jgi:hypothetical protein
VRNCLRNDGVRRRINMPVYGFLGLAIGAFGLFAMSRAKTKHDRMMIGIPCMIGVLALLAMNMTH